MSCKQQLKSLIESVCEGGSCCWIGGLALSWCSDWLIHWLIEWVNDSSINQLMDSVIDYSVDYYTVDHIIVFLFGLSAPISLSSFKQFFFFLFDCVFLFHLSYFLNENRQVSLFFTANNKHSCSKLFPRVLDRVNGSWCMFTHRACILSVNDQTFHVFFS